jgi:hypothetical protein
MSEKLNQQQLENNEIENEFNKLGNIEQEQKQEPEREYNLKLTEEHQAQIYKQMGYIKGKIYKIICLTTHEVYIGSTTQTLKKRMSNHRSKSNSCVSKQIINRNNYIYGTLLESYFPNQTELLKIEKFFIQNAARCINKQMPILNEQEKIENKKNYDEKYYNKNKDYKKKYDKERYLKKKHERQFKINANTVNINNN